MFAQIHYNKRNVFEPIDSLPSTRAKIGNFTQPNQLQSVCGIPITRLYHKCYIGSWPKRA